MTKKELENKFLDKWCPNCDCKECPMSSDERCMAIAEEDDEKRHELIKTANEYGEKHPDQFDDGYATLEDYKNGCGGPEPVIKDSGDRTQYSTGAVRDCKEGKGRCDLMPLDVVASILYDARSDRGFCLQAIYEFEEIGDPGYLEEAILSFSAERGWENLSTAMLDVSKHFEEGAKKYGENNWQKGIPVHSYIDSAIRHYLKFRAGWTDEPHDRAFVWNLMCCIWTMKNKPELDDFTEKRKKDD